MEAAMAELPLAFFTTFVLIGAGAFILQAFVPAPTQTSAQADKKIDLLSFVPMIVTLVGFCAAFVHLASPMNAPYALAGIGRSPMSNEIAMGSLFLVAAIVYCVLSSTGKLAGSARKGFAFAMAALGLLFAIFTGAAYLMNTIVSWYSSCTIAETIGFALFAGGVLCAMMLTLTGNGAVLHQGTLRNVALALIIVGAILGFGALAVHVSVVGGYATAMASGATLVQGVMGCMVLAIVCAVAGAGLACAALIREMPRWVLPVACALALVAVFAARLVFYAMQMSIGL